MEYNTPLQLSTVVEQVKRYIQLSKKYKRNEQKINSYKSLTNNLLVSISNGSLTTPQLDSYAERIKEIKEVIGEYMEYVQLGEYLSGLEIK